MADAERLPLLRGVGDRPGLDRLYRDHWQDVCRYVARRFGSGPPEPEEVAQAAFERLAKADRNHEDEGSRFLLFTIAANIVRDHHRRAAIRASVHGDLALHEHDLSEITPERVLCGRERMEAFKAAIAAMPVQRRRVFLFVRIEGLSVPEAARHFAMSEATVYKHVSRGLHDCMAALDAFDREGEMA